MRRTTKCVYCHQDIATNDYLDHVRDHKQLQEDGQQNEYVTLPENERIENIPDGTPQDYIHFSCQEVTIMPHEIVASYLKNPFLYMADQTYCVGCEKHVPISECEWVETNENLKEYMQNLRSNNPHLKPNLWQRFVHFCLSPA